MVFENFTSAHFTVLWLAFGIAFVMGAVVNKTHFCTMGAVSDWVNMGHTGRMRAWIFAGVVGIIGVIFLESFHLLSTDGARPPYRGGNFAWLEYLLGGLMFGVGMTLGSGCGNKTLIRIGGGNIKSLFVFFVIGVFAYYMVNPLYADVTLYSLLFYPWTNPTTIGLSTRQDLGSLAALALPSLDPALLRMVIGAVLALVLLFFVFKSEDFRKSFDNILGGLVVGLAVLAAWYLSGSYVQINADGEVMTWTKYASDDVWTMVQEAPRPKSIGIQGLSFINPIGESLGYSADILNSVSALQPRLSSLWLTFGVMTVFGVIAGSFVWAVLSRGFRVEWFASKGDFLIHLVGGVLMGIGGVLALGCTIGQAVTGVSTLALGSFIAFAGIIIGSAVTMKIQFRLM